jgi:hypothetical protein
MATTTGKTTMIDIKDWASLIFVVVGFMFGVMFDQHFRQREKLEAIETSHQNTEQIIETSQNIKDKVQNAEDKNCVDIFNIDITKCVR